MSTDQYKELVEHDLLGAYKALAAQSGNYKTALQELIDNAFDKASRCITLTIDKAEKKFSIQDDGVGTDHLALFVGLGKRQETKENKIGRHGWGAKHALLFIAHDVACRIQIESISGSTRRSTATTFERIAAERSLPVTPVPIVPGSKKGTTIRLYGIKRPHIPSGKAEIGKLMSELGFAYSLAIEDQRTIIIDEICSKRRERHLVDAYVAPKFADEVKAEFQMDARRSVRLHVGVVAQGESNDKPGLHYRYGYRVVEASSSKGCNGYSTARIFGYIDLIGDGWKLSALKDEVYEPGALHAEVLARIHPLLKAAQSQLMLAESAALIESVEGMLDEALKDSKAQRGRGKKKGTKLPTGRGGSHSDAETKQPGQTMPSGEDRRGRVHIEFADINEDEDRIGAFTGNTIRLNTRMVGIRRMRSAANADAIFSLAMSVYFVETGLAGCLDFEHSKRILKAIGGAFADSESRLDGKKLSDSAVAAE